MSYALRFTPQAQRDARKLASSGLRPKAEAIFSLLVENPFRNPPPYKRLRGDMKGAFSRRLNIQHRVVYQVLEEEKIVKVLRCWTHYE